MRGHPLIQRGDTTSQTERTGAAHQDIRRIGGHGFWGKAAQVDRPLFTSVITWLRPTLRSKRCPSCTRRSARYAACVYVWPHGRHVPSGGLAARRSLPYIHFACVSDLLHRLQWPSAPVRVSHTAHPLHCMNDACAVLLAAARRPLPPPPYPPLRTDRGSLLLFEVPSYALLKVVIVSAEREEVSKVGMSPSGRIVACCLANSGVTVVHNLDWDREVTRHKAHQVRASPPSSFSSLASSCRAALLRTCGEIARGAPLATLSFVWRFLISLPFPVRPTLQGSIVSAMAWSETGAFFVTGDRRGRCFRHTMTPSWASPLDVKLILQCRTPIVQVCVPGIMYMRL